MTFKAQWYRDKFAKKRDKGFCGYPVATVAFYGPADTGVTKVSIGIVAHEGADADPLERVVLQNQRCEKRSRNHRSNRSIHRPAWCQIGGGLRSHHRVPA
jgi:hypothetical protein